MTLILVSKTMSTWFGPCTFNCTLQFFKLNKRIHCYLLSVQDGEQFTNSNENRHPFNMNFRRTHSLPQPAQTRIRTPDLPHVFDCPDEYAWDQRIQAYWDNLDTDEEVDEIMLIVNANEEKEFKTNSASDSNHTPLLISASHEVFLFSFYMYLLLILFYCISADHFHRSKQLMVDHFKQCRYLKLFLAHYIHRP